MEQTELTNCQINHHGYILYSTILYYVMSAGKFKSLKMGGLNDVLTITATLQLTKTQIWKIKFLMSEKMLWVVFLKSLLVCFTIE